MYRELLTSLSRPLQSLVVAGLLVFHPGVSMAQTSPLSQQQVSQFLSNPSAVLAANPNGGGRLVSFIRDLLLSSTNTSTLQAIIALLATANADQQSAIGSGLGQAAQALASTNPDFTNQIQAALARSGSQLALASYQATTGDVQVGAGGGGAGGGGGPTSGGTSTGGGGGGSGGSAGSSGSGNQGANSQGQNGVNGSNSQGQNNNSQGQNVSPI